MSVTWVESRFDAGGRHIGVSVKRLDDREGERLAAEMAWFAEGLLANDVDLESGWATLLQQLLSEHVAITVDEDLVEQLDGIWDQVVYGALEAFMQANNLAPALRRYLCTGPRCES